MKQRILPFSFLLILTLSLVFSGCRKSDRAQQTDYTNARDNSLAQEAFSSVWKQIGEVVDSTSQLRLSSCVTTNLSTTDTVTWPKTLTIDFGTTNCLCADGNSRRGIITAVFSGKYRATGTIITINLSNYYYNDLSVQGTQVIANNGLNSSGNYTYSVTVNNGIIGTSGGTITWNTSQTREWTAGASTTANPWDDIYLITGTSNGRGVNGNSFTCTINAPLKSDLSCQHLTSGTFTTKPSNYSEIKFDYGNGTCDNKATATINGINYDITLQ